MRACVRTRVYVCVYITPWRIITVSILRELVEYTAREHCSDKERKKRNDGVYFGFVYVLVGRSPSKVRRKRVETFRRTNIVYRIRPSTRMNRRFDGTVYNVRQPFMVTAVCEFKSEKLDAVKNDL